MLLAMSFLVAAMRRYALPSFDMFQLHIGEIILLFVAALMLPLVAFAGK